MPLWNLSGNSIQDGDFLGTTNNRALIFKSNSVEGFRLLPNGYLGIGINNPQALLDIGGDAIFRENLFAHGNIILGENSNFIFPENFSMTLAFLEIENQLKIGNSLLLNHDNEIYTASNSGALYIQSDKYNQNTIINLNNDGYVGIGTDTPEKKLHVKHKVLTLEPIPIFPADTIIFNETFFNNSIEERDNLIANEEIRGSIRIETEAEAVATGNIHISKWDIEPAASPLVDYPHRLHFKDAVGGHTVMTMVGNGTVGIGTGAPGARLHVHNGNMAVTNGRIGIGTETPQAMLDIRGDAIINGMMYANNDIIIGENASLVFPENYTIAWPNADFAESVQIGNTIISDDNHIYTTEGSGPLYIQSQEYGQNTIINYTNNGKVGIGTVNPQKKLHIKEIRTYEDEQISHPPIKQIVFDSVYINTPVDERDLFITQNERRGSITTEIQYFNQAGLSRISRWDIEPATTLGSGPIYEKGQNKLHFKNYRHSSENHHTVMTLTELGTVGIGTMSPGARLHVHNGDLAVTNGNISIGRQKPSAELDVAGRTVITHTSSDSAPLQLINNSSNGSALTITSQGSQKATFFSDGSAEFKGAITSNDASFSGLVTAKNANFSGILTAKNANFSGILTAKKANFSDGLTTSEIKVTLEGADFVFEQDYNLMSLSDLELFIKQNKHLPEIPPATEMESEEGFPLGALNTKLLQKIEELTLYIIEQNKRIEELERMIKN